MSELALAHLYRGKVRDLYEVDDDHLLMVASDRLSAFDVVMNEPIPDKGRVLTAFTHYWTRERVRDVASAMVSCDPTEIDEVVPGFLAATAFHGRSALVRRAQMVPLECIVRARLAGQAYDEYVTSGTVHGALAPAGLRLGDPFPEPIFTPSTKAISGHDENIDLDAAAALVGRGVLDEARELCGELFARAANALSEVGLVLADTKFEVGVVDGRLVVCDEVVTPDSSRIWPADAITPGETPPAYDKQPFRDWLDEAGWDRSAPPPTVPPDVVALTAARYVSAYERVSGRRLRDWYGAGQ